MAVYGFEVCLDELVVAGTVQAKPGGVAGRFRCMILEVRKRSGSISLGYSCSILDLSILGWGTGLYSRLLREDGKRPCDLP